MPAIILAGAIGYSIGNVMFTQSGELKKELSKKARAEIPRYPVVISLLLIGAVLEG